MGFVLSVLCVNVKWGGFYVSEVDGFTFIGSGLKDERVAQMDNVVNSANHKSFKIKRKRPFLNETPNANNLNLYPSRRRMTRPLKKPEKLFALA